MNHAGSGGNRYENDARLKGYMLPEAAPGEPCQLYHLEEDPGETRNRIREEAEKAGEMKALLEATVAAGRSRPMR
jgi:hypothetical protein